MSAIELYEKLFYVFAGMGVLSLAPLGRFFLNCFVDFIICIQPEKG